MASTHPLLKATGLRKLYPGTLALDDVDFTLFAGEVHALMGENGAGKSTLIKILTGAESRDKGSILLEGHAVELSTTAAAQNAGVWAVHQEVMVLPNLSVAENLLLGFQPTRFGFVDRRKMRQMATAILSELSLDLDVDRPLGSYSVAVQQLVAIARAIRADAKVLVLDEPTASLDPAEVERLFALVRKLAARGTGIVFITHFLDQLYAISDRITVLRNGQAVGTFDAADLPRTKLVSLMIGRALDQAVGHRRKAKPGRGPAAIHVQGIGRKGMVEPFNLTLHAGEAVGAAGLLGSGRSETALLMFGAKQPDCGAIVIDGRPIRMRSPRDAIRAGLAMSPEDRKTVGIFGDLSIRDNIAIALQAKRGWWRKLPRPTAQKLADQHIRDLNIKTPDADKPIGQLSGGNQQKALLARCLATSPKILILDEPTRGIDVGAHAEIVKLIEGVRDRGMALYVISSEIDELIAYSDRISVMRDRRQVRVLDASDLSVDTIVAAIAAPSDEA